jgi:hypothetical protein
MWKSVSSFGSTAREILKVDNLFQSGAGSAYFGLTGTQGRTILMFPVPPNGVPVIEDNATIHTPEFEEREKCTVNHQAAQLGTPIGIAVRQKGIQ